MPIPQPEKKKPAPSSAKRNKHDYPSIMVRAKARRTARAIVRRKRLARLKAKRYDAPPFTEAKRRAKRILRRT